MNVRVAINGFGRIGRSFLRAALAGHSDLDIVAVNDLAGPEAIANLLRRDSIMGSLREVVSVSDGRMRVGPYDITIFSERNPVDLPWAAHDIDVVVESTGLFTTRASAAQHLAGGARRVIVSAPCNDADITIVMGVNDDSLDIERHHVISNASCTTNCLAPMINVLDDAFGIQRGLMTTVHAYTGDQLLVDGPHSDARRSRAAALNIVPTSTGAARATGLVLASMSGRLDGIAVRVPVPVGSLTDFVGLVDRDVSVDEVNEAFSDAANGALGSVMHYSSEPLVSSDIIGSPASCIIDAQLTMASANLVKVCGWYDNEWGYSNRLAELAQRVGAGLACRVRQ